MPTNHNTSNLQAIDAFVENGFFKNLIYSFNCWVFRKKTGQDMDEESGA
jgi:hypothetical protein